MSWISIYYYIIAIVLLVVAVCFANNSLIVFLAGWFGFNFLAVAIAYTANRPQIFRKKQSGRIPTLIRWLFLPFLLCIRFYNFIERYYDPVPALQEIEPNLYLARRLLPSDSEMLRAKNINAVLDVTAEFNALDIALIDEDPDAAIDYLNLPVLDHSTPDRSQLKQGLNWLHAHQSSKNAVVVHCALGRGRSVFMVAAYLMALHPDWSLEKTMDKISGIRSTARLNRSQTKRLLRYKKKGLLKLSDRACLIVNPVSGGGKWAQNEAEIYAALRPYFFLDVRQTSKEVSGKVLAERALKEDFDVIIACGGDGTVTEVASVLVNREVEMGIIPLGTTNALTHSLWGLTSKITPIETACEYIIQRECRKIDTAKCNHDLILLLMGFGFQRTMIEEASREKKNELGQLAYIAGLWTAVSNNEKVTLYVKFDDEEEQQMDVSSFVVANSAPFTSLLALGNGEPNYTDGELDITWVPWDSDAKQPYFSMIEMAFNGALQKNLAGQVKHKQAKRIQIRADGECNYEIDGEIFDDAKLDIQIQPASLKLLLPHQQ
ncbi:diacylglycerol kinase family protein [Gayadomonas joobiniege]|uniref:diacylglycerol kinase family protein n=1 Tax=Gayadomonas joobiniege TaxID=1234606 RepID=UPI00036EA15C|nr:diacylglycerol kinase family protein [Gayadomonas joobiniege]